MLNESKIIFKIPEYGAHWIYTCLNNEPAKNLKAKVSKEEENCVKYLTVMKNKDRKKILPDDRRNDMLEDQNHTGMH